VAELDSQGGVLKNGGQNETSDRHKIGSVALGDYAKEGPPTSYAGDTGTASRFFYCAKPARSERDEGLRDSRNAHPTVKPTELMEWLIKLITPPGATLLLLDPFTGSGTTGVAAMRLQHRFVGWEREPEYHRIAAKRIEAAAAQPHQLDLLGLVREGG
jgi:site-specific DNA-methyltransferase (adenine-specific)